MSDDKAQLNLALSLGYHQCYRQIFRLWRSISRFPTIVFKLDFLERIAISLDVDELVTKLIGHAYRMLVEIDQRNHVNYAYQAPLNSRGKRGRPLYEISKEQLHVLLQQGFKVCDISKILWASVRTVKRRMSTFGLSVQYHV